MREMILAGTVALAGCATTTADLRERAPFISTQSAKAPDEIAGCIAQQWTERSGVTSSAPRPNGQTLTLTYNALSTALPAATVDIDGTASGSTVAVYARGADSSDKLRAEVNGCL